MWDSRLRVFLTEEAKNFIASLPHPVAKKIYYNMRRIVDGERNSDLFKKLTGTGIWEFRTQYVETAYRLFAFWDNKNGRLIVVTHGVIKKTQKTSGRDIAKAEAIMRAYLNK